MKHGLCKTGKNFENHGFATQFFPAAELAASRLANTFARRSTGFGGSANAVTETGEIVNIDGTGNRVAMTAYGQEECYCLVGKNKTAPSLESALYRVPACGMLPEMPDNQEEKTRAQWKGTGTITATLRRESVA